MGNRRLAKCRRWLEAVKKLGTASCASQPVLILRNLRGAPVAVPQFFHSFQSRIFSRPLTRWRPVIGVLLWVLAAAWPASAGTDAPGACQEAWKAHMSQGVGLLRQQRFEAAKQEFVRATASCQERAEGFLWLGVAQLHLGEAGEAEKALRQALALDPDSAPAHMNLGLAYSRLGKPAEALGELEKAVSLDPKGRDGLYNLGVLLLEQDRPLEAAEQLHRARQAGLDAPEVSVHLVRAYLKAGKTEEAVQQAKAASARFEKSAALQAAMGKDLLAHGLTNPARDYLQKASRLVPCEPSILLPLADANLKQVDGKGALEALDCLADRLAAAPEYHRMRSEAHLLAGDKEASVAAIRRAMELDPRNAAYPLLLGRIHQKYGEQREAVEVLEGALEVDPTFAEIPYSIAVSYFIADKHELAEKYLARAVALDPDFERAYFLLAVVKTAQNQIREAEPFYRKALEFNPGNPYYYCMYGMALYADRRFPDSIESFEKSISLAPSYALAHYQLGRALIQQKKYREALRPLEKAIELRPDLTEAYYRLGTVYGRLGERDKARTALATFQRYRAGEMDDRQEMLKAMSEVVQTNTPRTSPRE